MLPKIVEGWKPETSTLGCGSFWGNKSCDLAIQKARPSPETEAKSAPPRRPPSKGGPPARGQIRSSPEAPPPPEGAARPLQGDPPPARGQIRPSPETPSPPGRLGAPPGGPPPRPEAGSAPLVGDFGVQKFLSKNRLFSISISIKSGLAGVWTHWRLKKNIFCDFFPLGRCNGAGPKIT